MDRPEIETMRTLFSLVSGGLIEMKDTDSESLWFDPEPESQVEQAPGVRAQVEPESEIQVHVEPEPVPEPEVVSASAEAPEETAAEEPGTDVVEDEWFADPVDAIDPMSTGSPADFDLDGVEVSVDGVDAPAEEDKVAPDPSVAFPNSDLPTVDRAAAARELSGLSADDSRRGKSSDASDEDDEESGKGLFSRLMGKP
jgi:hypothetical protein